MRFTLLTACLLGALALSAPAAADPINKNTVIITLTCPDAVYTGISILQNSALPFQIAGETFVAISQEISFVDGDGNLVVVRQNPGIELGRELVSCTYSYPGFPFLVTGRFLITGQP
jgi:hypothetical protein